jgi:hypothetical protein
MKPILTQWRRFAACVVFVTLLAGCRKSSVRDETSYPPTRDKEGKDPAAQCRGKVPDVAPRARAHVTWPGPGRIELTVRGSFSTSAPDGQNWMNAPPDQKRPPPLEVTPEWIDALDCAFTPTLKRAIEAGGPQGDGETFSLKVDIAGSDEVGGHYGGLTIRMEATSSRRPKDIVVGTSRVEAPRTGTDAVAVLAPLLDKALGDAAASLQKSIDESEKKPVRELTLVFETDNLSSEQRAYVDTTLVRCAVELGSSLAYDKIAGDALRYRVRYRLKKYEPDETEDQYVEKFASWLGEICDHGKCRCSTWRGPLDGMTSERRADVANKTVFVRLRRR